MNRTSPPFPVRRDYLKTTSRYGVLFILILLSILFSANNIQDSEISADKNIITMKRNWELLRELNIEAFKLEHQLKNAVLNEGGR